MQLQQLSYRVDGKNFAGFLAEGQSPACLLLAVLELARSGAAVACTIGFHAGLSTSAPDDAKSIRGKVLVCQGNEDPINTAEQREAFAREMTNAGVDWQMHLYGGVGHSFTNREIDEWKISGFSYDAAADLRSFLAMRELFNETLHGGAKT
jgi:dienelactone hydrolase